ncbi:hypothetical protein XACLE20_120001 [Xanthomonas citri pv. citri]|nr:hypothetical protein XACLE20_120001 [Xanthomonas citri pv. citri]
MPSPPLTAGLSRTAACRRTLTPTPLPQAGEGLYSSIAGLPSPAGGEGARRADGGQPLAERRLVPSSCEKVAHSAGSACGA